MNLTWMDFIRGWDSKTHRYSTQIRNGIDVNILMKIWMWIKVMISMMHQERHGGARSHGRGEECGHGPNMIVYRKMEVVIISQS